MSKRAAKGLGGKYMDALDWVIQKAFESTVLVYGFIIDIHNALKPIHKEYYVKHKETTCMEEKMSKSTKKSRSMAAKKAVATKKANALKLKRSQAAKKAAATRKANALAKKRSDAAYKAWATRRGE